MYEYCGFLEEGVCGFASIEAYRVSCWRIVECVGVEGLCVLVSKVVCVCQRFVCECWKLAGVFGFGRFVGCGC